MLKYAIKSPRLGLIAAFRFQGDLFIYLQATTDAADDWSVEVFGEAIGTIGELKTKTQVQLDAIFKR